MSILQLINANLSKLTPSERKVADYIITNRNDVVYGTMNTIKSATNVGDATIIRFSQKIGFSGFTDLKIALAKENYSSDLDDNKANFYDDLAETLIGSIKTTNQIINDASVQKAVQLMSKTKRIFIFGIGHSGEIAKVFAKNLLRVGLIASDETDPHFAAQVASIINHDDLIIAISLSGRTIDIIRTLEIAKKAGVPIIGITNNLSSEVATSSDVVLQTSVSEFLNGGSLSGQLSQLYICEVLTKGYEIQNKINVLELREKAIRAIIDRRVDD